MYNQKSQQSLPLLWKYMLRVPRHESRDAEVSATETSNHPPNTTKTHNPELLFLSSKIFYNILWLLWENFDNLGRMKNRSKNEKNLKSTPKSPIFDRKFK